MASSAPTEFFSSPCKGVFFALLATVVWSGNFIVGRELVGSVPPVTLAAARWGMAFCMIFPFALPSLRRDWGHLRAHWKFYTVISLIGISFFNTVLYYAAHTVSALNMSLIAITAPLFTLLLSRILWGEPLSYSRAVGLVIVLVGVVLLIARGDIQTLLSLSFQMADLLVLLGALSFSIYTLLVRKKPEGAGQLTFLSVTFGLGMLFLLPLSAWEIAAGAPVHITPKVLWLLVYLGAGPSLLSFWCWSLAIQHIGASRASLIYYTLPLFCGVEAVIFLQEPVLWVHYVSGAFILGGLGLATREHKKAALLHDK